MRNLFPACSLQTSLLRRSVFQSHAGKRYPYLALRTMKNPLYLSFRSWFAIGIAVQEYFYLCTRFLSKKYHRLQRYQTLIEWYRILQVSSCEIRDLFPACSLQTSLLRRSVFQSHAGKRYPYLAIRPMKNLYNRHAMYNPSMYLSYTHHSTQTNHTVSLYCGITVFISWG